MACVTPETFWLRETTTEGRFAEKIAPGGLSRLTPGAGAVMSCGSIFVRHHQGDGGLRVVNAQCAASGNQLHKPRCAVVVADIKRNGEPGSNQRDSAAAG
jgi:hypothetical protein